MTTPYDIDLNLNAQDYVTNASAALATTNQLNAQLGALGATAMGLNRIMSAVTPGRALTASFAAAGAAAARFQQQMSGLAATAAVTGADFGKISGGVRDIAKAFPVGTAGARAMAESLGSVGVAGKGTERQMKELSKTFTQLQGATSEFGPNMAAGMVQLDRAFGGGNIDPKRIAAMSDSLVSVSKHAGASATSVIQFSKSIAPMAAAAGIGQNATMGISAAFARMGEDGFGAANAMNKMLTDLNRSVREGSSDVQAYANILGTTAENLKSMYKSDPSEVITKITEAVAGAGGRGPRMLESLGLDGVRTQRALQALSASGGLRDSIRTAVAGTGGGDTAKGAEAAFGGLNDSLQKLATSAGLAGEAIGRPLLGPLSMLVDLAAKPLGKVGDVLDSKAGQTSMKVVGGLAVAGTIAAILAGKLLTASLIGQLLTASPLRGLIGGFGLGRAGMDPAQMGRFSRWAGGSVIAQDAQGRDVGAVTRRMIGWGAGAGDRVAGLPRTNLLGAAGRALVFGGQVYTQAVTDSARAIRLTGDPAARAALPGVGSPAWMRMTMGGDKNIEATARLVAQGEEARRAANAAARRGPSLSPFGMGRMLGDATTAGLGGTPTPITARRAAMYALGDMARQPYAAAGSMLAGAGRGLWQAIGSGPGLALTGGLVGGMALHSAVKGFREDRKRAADVTGNDVENRYLTAIGQATEATKTLAEQMRAAAGTASNMATTMDEATTVTDKTIAAANESKKDIVNRYVGTDDAQIAAQVLASKPGGLTPATTMAKHIDLLRQYDSEQVQRVLDIVTAAGGRGGGSIKDMVAAAGVGGSKGSTKTLAGAGEAGLPIIGAYDVPILSKTQDIFKPGAVWGPKLGKDQEAVVQTMVNQITKRQTATSGQYGTAYGQQQAFREMDEMMKEIRNTGNDELMAKASQILTDQLTAGKTSKTYRTYDLGANESFIEKFAAENEAFGKNLQVAKDKGITLVGPTKPPQEQLNQTADALKGFGAIGKAFSNLTADAERNRPVLDVMSNYQEDTAKQAAAVDHMIDSSRRAGDSLAIIADNALDAAHKVGATSDAFTMLNMVVQRVSLINQAAAPGRTPGQNLRAQMEMGITQFDVVGSSPEAKAQREQGSQKIVDSYNSAREALKAFLTQQREYEVSRLRGQRDFSLQMSYAEEDFHVSQERAAVQFNISVFRTERNYNLARERQEFDFNLNRKRSTTDYHLSVSRSTADFHLSQRRAQADFNISMTRMAEDAAAAMYDPYHRIQVKGVWDAQNLLINLTDQAKAMEGQAKDLSKIKKMGVTTDVIDLLGLDKAENAQQLSLFVANLMEDPKLVEQFNKNAAKREKTAGTLLTDSKEYRRNREDFDKAMTRQEDDFDKMMARQGADFRKQLSRNAKDFERTMSRAEIDFNTSMSDMSTDYGLAVEHANIDFDKQLDRQETAFNQTMTDMAADVERQNEAIAVETQDLVDATMTALNGGMVDYSTLFKNTLDGMLSLATDYGGKIGEVTSGAISGASSGARSDNQGDHQSVPSLGDRRALPFNEKDIPITQSFGNVPTGQMKGKYKSGRHTGVDYGVPSGTKIYSTLDGQVITAGWNDAYGNYVLVDHGKGRTLRYGHFSKLLVKSGQDVESGTLLGLSGSTGLSTGPHLHYEARVNGVAVDPSVAQSWMGRGGIVNKATIIGAGESGAEAIIPLDGRGVELMAAAMHKYADRDTLRGMAPGARPMMIVYNSGNITHDHRNDFGGARISVMAQDPDDMGRKLEAKARTANLTKGARK